MRLGSLLSLAALYRNGQGKVLQNRSVNGLPDFLGDESPISVPALKKIGSNFKNVTVPSRWDGIRPSGNRPEWAASQAWGSDALMDDFDDSDNEECQSDDEESTPCRSSLIGNPDPDAARTDISFDKEFQTATERKAETLDNDGEDEANNHGDADDDDDDDEDEDEDVSDDGDDDEPDNQDNKGEVGDETPCAPQAVGYGPLPM